MRHKHKALALSLTSWLPIEARARWLTTLFELYRVLKLGRLEPWLIERARAPTGRVRVLKILPFFIRVRLYSLAYVFGLHRKGHILPGVWKVLGYTDGSSIVFSGLPRDAFPDWLLCDLKRLGEIEPTLFPNERLFSKFIAWSGEFDPSVGRQYEQSFLSLSKRKFDVIVLAPWVKAGGADKGLRQYLEYYGRIFNSVLLITTYPARSTRLDEIPVGVDVLEVGLQWQHLLPSDQVLLLARFLLELEPKLVHNVLSELGWIVFEKHGLALKSSHIKLVASLFTEERDAEGCRMGYPSDYLAKCRSVIDALVTDNRPWATWFSEHYVLSDVLVESIHFYTTLEAVTARGVVDSVSRGKGRVLWAGRICPQKTPEVLLGVVRRLPGIEFHIFGPVEDSSSAVAHSLRKESNVRMHGEYRVFRDIALSADFDCLLYTSSFDGMPNVILEAAAEELPIIAPNHVGGLSDLLNESTSFCVADHSNIESFVDAIKVVLEDPELAKGRAREARRALEKEFSKEGFMRQMDSLIGKLTKNQPDA